MLVFEIGQAGQAPPLLVRLSLKSLEAQMLHSNLYLGPLLYS